MDKNNNPVMTAEEIRAILNIGRNQAYDFIRSGAIPYRKVGRKYFISRKKFYEWLDCQDANYKNDIAG